MKKVRVAKSDLPRENLDTVRLFHFFLLANNRSVSYSGPKGLRNIIKNSPKTEPGVTRIHYPGVGTFFTKGLRNLCKKGYGSVHHCAAAMQESDPYLRTFGRVLYFCHHGILIYGIPLC